MSESAGSGRSVREFQCLRCGTCCRWSGHVLLTDGDITRLSETLGLSEESFIESYTRIASNRAQLSLKDRPDGACIFLTGNSCEVYRSRPEQCRAFPANWMVKGCPALDK